MANGMEGPYNICLSSSNERVARVGLGTRTSLEIQVEAWWALDRHAHRKFADAAFEAIKSGHNPFTYRNEEFTWEKDNS